MSELSEAKLLRDQAEQHYRLCLQKEKEAIATRKEAYHTWLDMDRAYTRLKAEADIQAERGE